MTLVVDACRKTARAVHPRTEMTKTTSRAR